MQAHELMARLGHAASELTDEQIDRIAAEVSRIGQRYPDPDDVDKREAALYAAVRYLLGEIDLISAWQELIEARRRQRRAHAAAMQVAMMLAADNGGKGRAGAVGIDQMDLLKAFAGGAQ